MNIVNYISNLVIPIIILIIVFCGVIEKLNIFDLFIKGAKEGLIITFKLFPTLIGIFLAVGLLRSSGVLDFVSKILNPVIKFFNISPEIIPLALIRPISGSASIGIATDIMKNNGVDSLIGKTASVIMGATETTLYIIAIYTGSVMIKKHRGILIGALTADFIGIITAIIVCKLLYC